MKTATTGELGSHRCCLSPLLSRQPGARLVIDFFKSQSATVGWLWYSQFSVLAQSLLSLRKVKGHLDTGIKIFFGDLSPDAGWSGEEADWIF